MSKVIAEKDSSARPGGMPASETTKGLGSACIDGRCMTPAEAAELRGLCEEACLPHAFSNTLTARQAARRIQALRSELRDRMLPPHTD